MLEALSRLEGREGLRCIMVGSDQGREAYNKELHEDIVRLGLESVVHLPGDCRDMPAVLYAGRSGGVRVNGCGGLWSGHCRGTGDGSTGYRDRSWRCP